LDYLENPSNPLFAKVDSQFKQLTAEQSYNDKDLTKIFGDISTPFYHQKVESAILLPKQLGNTYTASMYMGLLSLLSQKHDSDLVSGLPRS
jgi:hydroxymethylglutaryl-CoA synthase